jgi:putative colanic acid biosynthesis acetyltransferase WcaF
MSIPPTEPMKDGADTAMRLDQFDNSSFERGRGKVVEALWLLASEALVRSWLPGSGFRVRILRLFGAQIGPGVVIKPHVRIKFPWRLSIGANSWIGEEVWIDNLVQVNIGTNCCISQGAYLCTGSHNWSLPTFDLITKPITIGDGAWICARSSVAPGVHVGAGAVLGFGAVATRDLEPWQCYGAERTHATKTRVRLPGKLP